MGDIDPLLIADDDFSDRYRVPGGEVMAWRLRFFLMSIVTF